MAPLGPGAADERPLPPRATPRPLREQQDVREAHQGHGGQQEEEVDEGGIAARG